MKQQIIAGAATLILGGGLALGQQADQKVGPAPIYRVTVVERTMKAINYQYRQGSTLIDFRGTVLLPKAKGIATVDSKRGRTEIEASFEHFTPPSAFGAEYLTYVLWAITPEGGPHNLGEIIPNGSDRASFRVTTDLQAFGMMVTAEPYSAVRQPSDVVVAENQVRDDTVGTIKEIEAKYELLPRGQYTWHMSDQLKSEVANAPKVSMARYEALSELYQAQNAVAIARVANAAQYAPNTFARAQTLLQQAQQFNASRSDNSVIVQNAREASEAAEDARFIALRRQQEESLAEAKLRETTEQQTRIRAEAEAQQAKAAVSAAQAQIEEEKLARQRAEANAAEAAERAQRAEAQVQVAQAQAAQASAQAHIDAAAASLQRQQEEIARKTAMRRQLLEQLNANLATRDTPRGLVVTVRDADFNGQYLRGNAGSKLAGLAQILIANPGLRIEIEGNADTEFGQAFSLKRAEAVRDVLVGSGVPVDRVLTRGLGNSRPLVSNSSPNGREENRRVEIVVSGEVIGNVPYWDRTYSLRTGG